MRAFSFSACGASLILICLSGCKADPPARLETSLMRKAKLHIFVHNKSQANPLKYDGSTYAEGRQAFSYYCSACHGLDGQNTGVPFADRMSPPVPLLTSNEVQAYSDGQLKWVIDNGLWPSGMPGSKGVLSDEENWSIVVYLRHLPPAGSLGEPRIYAH